MSALITISNLIIPTIFILIILFGYSKKVNVYDAFLEGAEEGLKIVVKILPTLIGLMVAVSIIRASGTLDLISKLLSPITNLVGFPSEVLPLALMRLISASASTGLLLDLFKTYGPDSFIGRFISIMMSCTETVFYTMSVYFLSVKITKTRYTLSGALIANVAGIIASLYITKLVFGY